MDLRRPIQLQLLHLCDDLRSRYGQNTLESEQEPTTKKSQASRHNGIVLPRVCVGGGGGGGGGSFRIKDPKVPPSAALTCMVPTKMLTDMKPCDLETFTSAGARKIATRNPIE